MIVRIRECKLRVGHTRQELEQKICRILHIRKIRPAAARASGREPDPPGEIPAYEIVHRSLDARKKPELFYIYTIDVRIRHPQETAKKAKDRHVTAEEEKEYSFPVSSPQLSPAGREKDRPVIVGCGPAGLFCALMLSRAGREPIVLERGEDADARRKSVEHFWETGELNPSSNVQFGEGGAGTFSDGKLNTSIRDPGGRIRFVLQEFVRAGADPSILWEQKPHIGTDVLLKIVKHMREEIISLGGEIRFNTCLTGLAADLSGCGNQPSYLLTLNGGEEFLHAHQIVLAIGHSARDTFEMLQSAGFAMEAKAFAVGLRVEHPQALINLAMLGMEEPGGIGAASYKLTHQCADGRGVYSFCMCPGGYVVNASSEPGMTAVNGMSFSGRNGRNANSAVVVTVSPEDYRFCLKSSGSGGKANDPLSGLAFQRMLERAAWNCADGKIPVQCFGDYCRNRPSTMPGSISPENRGQWAMANLRSILPEQLNRSVMEGMHAFAKRIPGFDAPDVLLSGVESRTSSPVRILRNGAFQSCTCPGIYPCGEGAGYAGGITSAAIDGIRVAEALL